MSHVKAAAKNTEGWVGWVSLSGVVMERYLLSGQMDVCLVLSGPRFLIAHIYPDTDTNLPGITCVRSRSSRMRTCTERTLICND